MNKISTETETKIEKIFIPQILSHCLVEQKKLKQTKKSSLSGAATLAQVTFAQIKYLRY
jgi:hypothetical protein